MQTAFSIDHNHVVMTRARWTTQGELVSIWCLYERGATAYHFVEGVGAFWELSAPDTLPLDDYPCPPTDWWPSHARYAAEGVPNSQYFDERARRVA